MAGGKRDSFMGRNLWHRWQREAKDDQPDGKELSRKYSEAGPAILWHGELTTQHNQTRKNSLEELRVIDPHFLHVEQKETLLSKLCPCCCRR